MFFAVFQVNILLHFMHTNIYLLTSAQIPGGVSNIYVAFHKCVLFVKKKPGGFAERSGRVDIYFFLVFTFTALEAVL